MAKKIGNLWYVENRNHKAHFFDQNRESACSEVFLGGWPEKRWRDLTLFETLPPEKCCKKCLNALKKLEEDK